MTLWQRVRQALDGKPAADTEPGARDDRSAAPVRASRPADQLGAGDGGTAAAAPAVRDSRSDEAAPDIKRIIQDARGSRGDLDKPKLGRAVDQLLAAGHQQGAIDLLSRLVSMLPEDEQILLRLAELLCAVDRHERALPVLRRLLAVTGKLSYVLRARLLTSEVLLSQGEAEKARSELSAILADDLDYPSARERLEKLGRMSGAARGKGDGANAGPRDPAPERTAGVGQMLPTVLGPGGVRHQRYQLMRELGRGSAGTVYLARDQELQRELAIKIFHKRRSDAGKAAWAWNEARLTASIRHPGVVAIYELDDERNLMVMELCQGETLRQRLQQGQRLPVTVALLRMRELLDTLARVHRIGVMHGDLKPGNLLFRGPAVRVAADPGTEGSVTDGQRPDGLHDGPSDESEDEEQRYGDLVFADFGTARLVGAVSEQDPGAGTLGYLAPERRRQPDQLTPSADVYAIGAIALEMLLGSLPLSRWGMLRGDQLPTRLSAEVAKELGPHRVAVEAVLGRLLSEDPLQRPSAQEAHEMLVDLTNQIGRSSMGKNFRA